MNEEPVQQPAPLIVQESKDEKEASQKRILISLVVIVILVLVGLATGTIFLLRSDVSTTSHIRDIFIIFMALESFIIGLALIILIVQLATLINLLQNEIKPILNSTSETVNTLRGTATFLSDNLAEPVIKLNETVAVVRRLVDFLKVWK
jgi:ABC-type dipeptide/oligopeptide/nickel transport system permease component